MKRKPNAELVDDGVPELGSEWFARAKPASEVLPSLMGATTAGELLRPKRGRPALDEPKQHVNIRLDPDILRAFKSKGPGWQTKVNAALRDWLASQAAHDA